MALSADNRRAAPTPATVWIGAAGILLVLAIGAYGLYRIDHPSPESVRAAADAGAYELERTPVRGLGITSFDVQEAIQAGDHGGGRYDNRVADHIAVTDKGSDARGDLYEITTPDGDNPVCLIVTVDEAKLLDDDPVYPDVEVEDGRCQPEPMPTVS